MAPGFGSGGGVHEEGTSWRVTLLAGAGLAVLGGFAFLAAAATGVATVLALGGVIVVSGAIEVAYAVRSRRRRGFMLPLLSGVLSLVVGSVFLLRPLAGLAAISLMLASFFVASGLFRSLTSLLDRYAHWAWDFIYGVVAIALGAWLLAGWPASSHWTIGVLVGAELIARGAALAGAGLALRRGMRPATASP